jgi:hypothetical protein
MEYSWLCEESLHCLEAEDVCWGFVYQHASHALQVQLRSRGAEFVQPQVAEAMTTKRNSIRATLLRGYRRPSMKRTIALHRLAIQQGCTVEKLLERMPTKEKVASPSKKQAAPKARAKVSASTSSVCASKILNKNEAEVAWLLEESIMQNALDGIDYQYVLDNASPLLRAEIERHKRRWLPRLVRMNCSKVKQAFEQERDRIYQLLWTGYRRAETKAALPAGRVTSSVHREQQNSRAA